MTASVREYEPSDEEPVAGLSGVGTGVASVP
jgi:hypothetical protein